MFAHAKETRMSPYVALDSDWNDAMGPARTVGA
jgi:hypothetical protein